MAKVSNSGKSDLKHKARAAKLGQGAATRDGASDGSKAVDPAAAQAEDRGAGGGLLLYLGGAVGAGGLAAVAAGGAKDTQLQVFTPALSANRAPVLTLQSGTVTQQDQPVLTVFTASDLDGDPLTYSITQGAHGSASIVAGAITYTPKPGFVGLDSVTATISDGRGGEVSQALTIQVRDNVAPKFTSPSKVEIAENIGAAQVVYRAVASDASALTYSLRSWDDAALFSIDAATGAVTLRENPDFERKSSYAFTVVATDSAGSSSEQAVTIRVTDVFEDASAPIFTSSVTAMAIREDTGADQQVYRAAATDASPITFSLKAAGDAASFSIDAATGVVILQPNPNYALKSSYAFTVVAADSFGQTSERTVTLAIIDARAPVFTSSAAAAVDEASGAGQVVYTAVATDASAFTYSLKAVGDVASFSINSMTGAVTLLSDPNYEIKPSYAFTVIATDQQGNASEKAVSLAVNDIADLSVFSTGAGFSVRLYDAGSIAMSVSGALGNYALGVTPLTQQASLKEGFLSLTVGGQVISTTPQYVVLGTSGNEFYDAGPAGIRADYIFGGAGNDTLLAGEGNDILIGGDGDDTLYGNEDEDLIYGGSGNDFIQAGRHNDTVYGGAGNDSINGGSTGVDTLYGEDGDDRFYYAKSADLFTAGQSVDLIDGGSGTNTLVLADHSLGVQDSFDITVNSSFARIRNISRIEAEGAYGAQFNLTINDDAYEAGLRVIDLSADTETTLNANFINVSAETGSSNGYTLIGHNGLDSITGGAGSDTITGLDGVDTLSGGAGSDTFVYASMAQFLSSNAVVDTITGGLGTDVVRVDAALAITTNDSLARAGAEILRQNHAGAASVVMDDFTKLGSIQTIDIAASTTNSTLNLSAMSGPVDLIGGEGNDLILGTSGPNNIQGGGGNDTIRGGDGPDQMLGGAGDDLLEGGSGPDLIFPDAGADTVVGGAGPDTMMLFPDNAQDMIRIIDADSDSTPVGMDSVQFFEKTSDKVDLSSARVGGGNASAITFSVAANVSGVSGVTNGINGGKLTFDKAAPTSLADAISKVGESVSTAGKVVVFDFNGLTYFFADTDGTTATSTDLVIQFFINTTGVSASGEVFTFA